MSLKKEIREMLQKNSIGRGIWRCLHNINLRLNSIYPDEVYFKRAFFKATGKVLDFSNPKTFDEKQLWLKMYYRDPLCTKCSDKYLVREYVRDCGLESILNPLFGVYDSFAEIQWDKLPNRFYLKANHMSACNVRCNDLQSFDMKRAEKILNRGLKHNYYLDSREWNYKDIPRKIIAEEIIESDGNTGLIDYRFLCSYGHCEYLFVDIETATEDGEHNHAARRNVYSREMEVLPVKVTRETFPAEMVQKPENYSKMVEYAEKLSKPFPFCRVDLYNVDGRIIFGEITFFHSGGISRIEPEEWREKMGDFIDIERAKEGLKEG